MFSYQKVCSRLDELNENYSIYCKIKRKFTFLVNTKYISSRELKTSKFSFVVRTHEKSDVFNTIDEIYLVFTSKSKYPLFIANSKSLKRVKTEIKATWNIFFECFCEIFNIGSHFF